MADIVGLDPRLKRAKSKVDEAKNHRDEALIILHEAIKKSKSDPFKKKVGEMINILNNMVDVTDECFNRYIAEEVNSHVQDHNHIANHDQDSYVDDENQIDEDQEPHEAAQTSGYANNGGMGPEEEDEKAFYVLGIEVGLQACKLSVIHSFTHEVIEQHSTVYNPEDVNRAELPSTHHQQSVAVLLNSIQATLK